MQYPQIQFYKGSLVRLASGKLKQVEDLSSEDFLESARLISRPESNGSSSGSLSSSNNYQTQLQHQNGQSNLSSSTIHHHHQHQQHQLHHHHHQQLQTAHTQFQAANRPNNFSLLGHYARSMVDENNNPVFNSPEPTASYDSPTMELMEMDEEEDEDEELDVVSNGDQLHSSSQQQQQYRHHLDQNGGNSNSSSCQFSSQIGQMPKSNQEHQQQLENSSRLTIDDDLYIDSSVVKDFLEVGSPNSTSPTSSTSSQHLDQLNNNHNYTSTSSSSSPSSSIGSPAQPQNPTVLIKFFLESSRSIVFIEVPIEHPFFVFHRGWSSWNPQRTYDKFGLKCRKLKIGDTCISLIRKQRKQVNPQQQLQQQQDSDQCNILFSSIKINE